jgi:hypothetical protein
VQAQVWVTCQFSMYFNKTLEHHYK